MTDAKRNLFFIFYRALFGFEAVTSSIEGAFSFPMKESDIQTKIRNYLIKKGWLPVKIIQCTLNGWPDMQALRDSRTVFIEVKRPGEKPTELQMHRHEQLRKQGFEVIVATSINEVSHL